jgi:hypothetical protein
MSSCLVFAKSASSDAVTIAQLTEGWDRPTLAIVAVPACRLANALVVGMWGFL